MPNVDKWEPKLSMESTGPNLKANSMKGTEVSCNFRARYRAEAMQGLESSFGGLDLYHRTAGQ